MRCRDRARWTGSSSTSSSRPTGRPSSCATLPGVTTQDNAATPRNRHQHPRPAGLRPRQRADRRRAPELPAQRPRRQRRRSTSSRRCCKSVDITRGPTATIYGSGAIGGVVAFELIDADDILRPGEYAAIRIAHALLDQRQRLAGERHGRHAKRQLRCARSGQRALERRLRGRRRATRCHNSADEDSSYLGKARWRQSWPPDQWSRLSTLSSHFVDSDATEPTPSSCLRYRCDEPAVHAGLQVRAAGYPAD